LKAKHKRLEFRKMAATEEVNTKTIEGAPENGHNVSPVALPSADISFQAEPPPSEPPPKGPRLRSILLVGVVVVALLMIGVVAAGPVRAGARFLWHNVFAKDAPLQTGATKQYYTCGMHPWVILPKPGDCPICGMKLVPLDPAKFTGDIKINPAIAQNIGVRIQPVTEGIVTRTVRTVGSVTYDEAAVRDVNLKVSGWIEKLDVDYVGAAVTKGQPLFDIYSPDLYAAQQEYLLAFQNQGKIGASFVPDAARGNANLLEAARTKLEYYDLTPEQIHGIEKAGVPQKTLTILSPYSGIVTKKDANEGMNVSPGMRVYQIADLSKVWVQVTVYEDQLPFVHLGQSASMALTYLPDHQFTGKVIYIYPYLEQMTRQAKVRLAFENPDGLLKPGMFATISLQDTLAGQRTLAPRSAVIDTGERQVAFVSQGEGRFQPRNVKMGVQSGDDQVEITSGLKPGEMVVTSAQFLLDSEANLRANLGKMIKGNLAATQPYAPPPIALAAQPSTPTLSPTAELVIDEVLRPYLGIQSSLVKDQTQSISASAHELAAAAEKLGASGAPVDRTAVKQLHDRAQALEAAKGIDDIRKAFASVSDSMSGILKETGVPAQLHTEIVQHTCPMGLKAKPANWLQPAGAVQNPYLGQSWPDCDSPDLRVTMPMTK